MKDLMKELLWLAVLLLGMLVLLFGGLYVISLMMKGIDFLPHYIGGFGTFMLYVAGFLLLLSIVLYLNKK